MVKQQQQGIKWNLSPIAILSWFALMAQFYLIICPGKNWDSFLQSTFLHLQAKSNYGL